LIVTQNQKLNNKTFYFLKKTTEYVA